MKKRLRKKKHLGEFVEWGVPIIIVMKQSNNFEHFLDSFIQQAIEDNGCYFGGGGKEDQLEGVIELGKAGDRPQERLKAIKDWLEMREDVQTYMTGTAVDLWQESVVRKTPSRPPSSLMSY